MATSHQNFSPRWASPPGDTINEALVERGMDAAELGKALGISKASTGGLFDGTMALTIRLAEDLAVHLGGTAEFWMSRDCQYRDDVARVKSDAWAQSLPLKEMARLGWIEESRDWRDQLENCLAFFGVDDLEAWNHEYGGLTGSARFRTSPTFAVSSGAVAAWMRQGEIIAGKIESGQWSPDRFRDLLDDIRRLTRCKDPAVFLPRLVELCAEAGVAVATLPAPKGCPVSGAARFLNDSTAMILLSARYLSDDHFWFTFFHEAGHLLLHDRAVIHIDDLDSQLVAPPQVEEEAEANDFASDLLVDAEELAGLAEGTISYRAIMSFAKRTGVAPGIVVGQLQHRHGDKVGFSQYNKVKRRFRWVGSSLEMA